MFRGSLQALQSSICSPISAIPVSNSLLSPARQTLPPQLFPQNMHVRKREKALLHYVQATKNLLAHLETWPDQQLAEHIDNLRADVSLNDQENITENFICAAAIGASAVKRTLGFQLHEVQIRGALAASSGSIIEMQTGEGKTVVCGLTALIRTIFDDAVHVATTNDYLAERDHASVEPIFRFLGITSSVIRLDYKESQTRAAYRSQITYGPGYLFGFDYLRDQIKLKEEYSISIGRDVLMKINGRNLADELAQYTHQSIIVDEADSVLIDESTTPLILSGGPETDDNPDIALGYESAHAIANLLIADTHYTIDFIDRRIELTEEGMELIHTELETFGKIDLFQPWPVYIRNALFAKFLLQRDEHYVVEDEQIKLVDQNTGRIFEDRTMRGGLHQALEASEKLPVNPPGRTLARVTRQRFFQLYHTICGMTGTASGSEKELVHFYKSPVIPLPQNIPNKRIEFPERFFANQAAKLKAISADVVQRIEKAQPILIGTRTIKESILVNEALRAVGIQATLLNGVQDADEADIISNAGNAGSITIATNMAGRGTDIKIPRDAKLLGGLHVIATQRHTSRRVDRQLAGRSARQGDPGSVQFFVCSEDELFKKFGRNLASRITAAADSDGETCKDFSDDVARLQEKIERDQFDLRRKLVRQDGWMDQVRNAMVNDQSG